MAAYGQERLYVLRDFSLNITVSNLFVGLR